jgi:ubiquinone biosynthesis protein COQ9
MMTPPERTPERDAAIDALLAQDPAVGWSMGALRGVLRNEATAEDVGMADDDAEMLFPGGTSDLIEAFIDLADRRMEAAAEAADMTALRLPARVRAVIALRLAQHRPHRDAVRRAVAVLALPINAPLASRCTARTVDAIWYAAGDRSADFSWYTKRAILTAVYGATLLFWLRDTSEDDSATLAFLDRRLADVGRVGAARKRAEALIGRLRPGSAAA